MIAALTSTADRKHSWQRLRTSCGGVRGPADDQTVGRQAPGAKLLPVIAPNSEGELLEMQLSLERQQALTRDVFIASTLA